MLSGKNKSVRGFFVFLFIAFSTHLAIAVTGDLNLDSAVDWQDVNMFVDQWLAPAGCPGTDLRGFQRRRQC